MRSIRMAAMAGILLATGMGGALAAESPDIQEKTAEGRAVVKDFSTRLMQALRGAMEQGGPVQAIQVCKEVAPAIAEGQSTDGRTVGRTSLKVRNPDNAPDAWEQGVLETFARRMVQGTPPADLEHVELVEGASGRSVRYMKAIAIPADAPCLACHGSTLKPEVAETIAALYPEDTAVGYQAGDLRGAFTIEWPL